MKILHTSIECYPIAKVGGLADVVGSLPKYQNSIEVEASVILPFYDNAYTKQQQFKDLYTGSILMNDVEYPYTIRELISVNIGFPLYLVYIEGLLDRANVYGYEDDVKQYIAFQLVVLDWNIHTTEVPDVIHCHDYHTGLIPFLLQHATPYESIATIPTVLTIHNAQYQGWMSYDYLKYLPSFNHDVIGLLDWDHQINPLAAAIKCADRVTTVSPSYMKELQRNANGLESLLSHEQAKCVGILNGIDKETWNPNTDPMMVKNYTVRTVTSGRKENKKWLCNHFNLDVEKPLFGFIGRLVGEKGAELLPEIIESAIEKLAINILILGSGNTDTEQRLEGLKERYKGSYNAHIGYDEKLSHILYSGVDFLLMPSRVEPCGLNQMYALRYGLIPIVRRIGGLKDTIIDIGDDGFGICHDQVSVYDVVHSIERGLTLYTNQKEFKRIQQYIMSLDYSWEKSAQQYLNEYESLTQTHTNG